MPAGKGRHIVILSRNALVYRSSLRGHVMQKRSQVSAIHHSCGCEYSRQLIGCYSVPAASSLTPPLPISSAQVTHVTNPYEDATARVNPSRTTEVGTAIATEPAGSAIANQAPLVGKAPTFVRLRPKDKLDRHEPAMLQADGSPIVLVLQQRETKLH